MTEINIETKGLDEAIAKMSKFPQKMKQEMNNRMEASLTVLHENVPPYPPPPPDSGYRRTGTLGRSLGVGYGGGKTGKPSIYGIKGGGRNIEGRFGTNLEYAPYVIDAQRQAKIHKGRWWTMDTIKQKAEAKIKKIWEDMVKFILKM